MRIFFACAISTFLVLCTMRSASAGDDTIDWLMRQSSQPSTNPASQPFEPPATQPSVFSQVEEKGARSGTIVMSDGKKVTGILATTPEKPIRVWDAGEKEYRDIPFDQIKSVSAEVLWERLQEEWHFKESGSDIKEFTGKSYPARETAYTLELITGEKVKGSVAAPIYLQADGKNYTYILHKRDKGEIGQSLKDLIYIDRIEFDPHPIK